MSFFFFFFFFFGIYLYEYDLVFFFEWIFFFYNSYSMSLVFLFDWVSCFFMSFVFLISGCVLLYSLGYMSGDINLIRFYFLVFMFIFSMVLFILMPDLICLLLGWDGLGLVSYCLVIYYQNFNSLISGMVTLLMNRVGDVFLILSLGIFFNFGSFHYILYLDFLSNDFLGFVYLILLASFTKSAQFPFCFWLPMAMSAPTPVSSLVHSSTLVTSGLYLIIRFNYFIFFCDTYFLMFISLLTMTLSGFSACVENDLKKIVAFSTLSQLGFMFFVLSMGSVLLCFMHLLIHAIFKSLLFLCSGFFIHCFIGSQDIRFMGGLVKQCPYVSVMFFVSLICLCGFPFFSGFYSKDFIMELSFIYSFNFFFFFFFFFCIGLTYIYSFRLIYYLFFSDSFSFPYVNFSYSVYMNFSLFLLYFFCIFGGSFLFWLFEDDYFFILSSNFSVLPLFFFFFYFILFFYILSGLYFYLNLFFFYFFSSMWFLSYFSSSFILSRFFSFCYCLNGFVDSGWFEYFISDGLLGFISWLGLYIDSLTLNILKLYFFFFFFFFF
uniref:NADH-ubiquinone oxidoreductase chain 5 n=1 Tax=Pyrops lathburii TaxID=2873974 RepID=A0A9E8G395_9HEMI|nr:NADH dehydrogenase subunit 5 [Pyrops lathburii]UZT27058.1 NADH dehydrogenase subunit 5 [Pyrops lathburii]